LNGDTMATRLILGAEYDVLIADPATGTSSAVIIGVIGGLLAVAAVVIAGVVLKRRNRPTR
jgi:LPXTG-motif cell wall-anchored protein